MDPLLNPLPEVQGEAAPQVPADPRREDPPWGLWEVALIASFIFLAILVTTMTAIVLASPGHRLPTDQKATEAASDPRYLIPAQSAAYLGVIAFMVLRVRRVHNRDFKEALRWNWPRPWPLGMVAGVAVAFAVEYASFYLPIPKSLPIDKLFQDRQVVWLLAVFGVTLAPLVEELFFRGFLYPVLARRLGMATAVLLTALGFALIHTQQLAAAWAPMLVLLVVGVVFTLARALSGSLAVSLLMHMSYNFTIFAILFVATDQFRHLERVTR